MRQHKVRYSILIISMIIIVGIVFYLLSKQTNEIESSQEEEPSTDAEIEEERPPVEKPTAMDNIAESYDVIVIGGDPEGVSAAVSAARNGADVLLVEKREELGGLFTYGMLNFLDIPQGGDGESVSKGIYEEWHTMVGGHSTFGIQEAKDAFKRL